MAKNFEVTVKRKQDQNDYIEDVSPVSIGDDLVIDEETKDDIINKIRSISSELSEIENIEEKIEENEINQEDKVEEKEEDIKETEIIEEEKEEYIEERNEESIEKIETKKEEIENSEVREEENIEVSTKKDIEYVETAEERIKEDTEKIEIKEEYIEHVEESKEESIEEIRKEELENNEEQLESFDRNEFRGKCRVYRSKKINIDKPKEDIIVKVGNIDRSMYIESVEMLKGGANIVTMVVENITYYTSKPLSGKKDEKEYKRNQSICKSYEEECICFDGDVRNTTVITPYLIYMDVDGATEIDDYEIESASLNCINTKYVLDNGDIIDNNSSLLFSYIESLVQEYEITINIAVK
ncbi:Uncharacterised protein [uncultured Clostridium sp.]|nr:Uncharacterised protein [uncultured Clostridium sp.]SCJ22366.1 Uncharacterised protein [uncultured Clostridium sp.]